MPVRSFPPTCEALAEIEAREHGSDSTALRQVGVQSARRRFLGKWTPCLHVQVARVCHVSCIAAQADRAFLDFLAFFAGLAAGAASSPLPSSSCAKSAKAAAACNLAAMAPPFSR